MRCCCVGLFDVYHNIWYCSFVLLSCMKQSYCLNIDDVVVIRDFQSGIACFLPHSICRFFAELGCCVQLPVDYGVGFFLLENELLLKAPQKR